MLENYWRIFGKGLLLLFVRFMPKLPTERDYLAGVRHYCCVCRVFIRYSIQELDTVKNGILKLKKFYFDILDDLQEIKKVQPVFDFWDNKVGFKFRNWYTGKEGRSLLRNSIDFFLICKYNFKRCSFCYSCWFLFWFSLHFLCFS